MQADESLFKEKYISHGDIEKLLKSVKKEAAQKYSQEFKKSNATKINIHHRNQLLLHNHPCFEKECTVFQQKKRTVMQNVVVRYAKRKYTLEQFAFKY